jgi:hypothetical protein
LSLKCCEGRFSSSSCSASFFISLLHVRDQHMLETGPAMFRSATQITLPPGLTTGLAAERSLQRVTLVQSSTTSSNLPEIPRIATVHSIWSPSAVPEVAPSQAGSVPPKSAQQNSGAEPSPQTEIELGNVPDQPVAAVPTSESHQAEPPLLDAPTPQQIARARHICDAHGTSGDSFSLTSEEKISIANCCCVMASVEVSLAPVLGCMQLGACKGWQWV